MEGETVKPFGKNHEKMTNFRNNQHELDRMFVKNSDARTDFIQNPFSDINTKINFSQSYRV